MVIWIPLRARSNVNVNNSGPDRILVIVRLYRYGLERTAVLEVKGFLSIFRIEEGL